MDLAREVETLLGDGVKTATPLHGGDLSQVVLLELLSGRSVVVKSGPAPLVEADMLRAIRDAGAPAPEVLAASETALALERLPEGGGLSREGQSALGEALSRLHATQGARYGWPDDYAFGRVRILNARGDDWPDFWATNRLLAEADRLPADLAGRLETLAGRLKEILPTRPAPSLCHGDLWSGNVMAHEGTVSGLIDPAAYFGHGELDLAMLALFGSVPKALMEAYGRLEPDWEQRRAVYQLWPAIVHLRLFGGGYRPMVERLLAALRA